MACLSKIIHLIGFDPIAIESFQLFSTLMCFFYHANGLAKEIEGFLVRDNEKCLV